MRDTMMGSGWMSNCRTAYVTCPNCDKYWEDEFDTDDWGVIDEDIKCFNCELEFRFFEEKPTRADMDY